MTKTDLSNSTSANAQLSVILACCRANALIEILALINQLLAIVSLVFGGGWVVKSLATLALLSGAILFYFAVRLRLDKALFERWDRLNVREIDNVLKEINPNFTPNKTLGMRLQGVIKILKIITGLLALQSILLLIIAWH